MLLLIISCQREKVRTAPSINSSLYDKAWYYNDQNDPDSAFLYFSKVTISNADDSLIAKSYVNMAIIQSDEGDYFGSEETAVKSFNYFNEDSPSLSSAYNAIAQVKYNLKDYKNSVLWYDKAITVCSSSFGCSLYKNNKAVSLAELKYYDQAILSFKQLMGNDYVKTNNNLLSKAIDNYSWARWLKDSTYNALPGYLKALNIREKDNNELGQTASYGHLSNYYFKNNADSAFYYALKMYRVSKKTENVDDQLEALQKVIKLSPPKETKLYFNTYQNLSDSLQKARNAAKNQFALIRYETEKNKADNLKLQRLLSIAIFVLIAGSIITALWYRKRKDRMAQDSQNAIRESQLKTSKKVHDVVANGLYRVMTEIENQGNIDREHVLDKIEDLYEKSRDISYEKPELNYQNFHSIVSSLLQSFATDNTKVLIAGNTAEVWGKVNPTIKFEIEHILQELMVNMKKHSGAGSVALRFECKQGYFKINYTDDGIGMPDGPHFKNGLRNTGNRIEDICGEITFDTNQTKGLKIQISFPIS